MSKANLANAILASAISDTATTVQLVAGYGATMPPTVPFKLTLTPFGQLSTRGNSEIILVTARSTDTLTVERGKGGTTAKPFEAGDIASNGIYIENSTAVGDIFMSMRATPAVGRLFMDGNTYNKADWPLLYKLVQDNAAYGTVGGSSGAETFTLADFRERMPFGKSGNSPWATLGYKAGTQTETLTVDQMPSHSHTLYAWVGNAQGGATNLDDIPGSGNRNTPGSQKVGDYMTSAGGGQAHNNMPPVVVVNYEVIAG